MQDKQTVFRYIEDHEDDMVEFLKKYVSIPSVNTGLSGGGTEAQVQKWLADELETYGFRIDKVAADPKQERPNVVAIYEGTGSGNGLILNGHSDTVEVLEPQKWNSDPFSPVVQNGKMYGRGVCDMKGGNTAAIWAVKALKDCNIELSGDVIMQWVIGEESNDGETIGTTAVLDKGYEAPFAIVVEPTDLEIHTSSVGLFCFEIIINGKGVHSCCRNHVVFPQPGGSGSGYEVGVDALDKALPFIDLFKRLELQWNQRWRDPILGAGGFPGHDRQGVGYFTINPGLIEGGTYLGAVPGYVKITYSCWYPMSVAVESIWKEIRDHVSAIASTDDWLRLSPPIVNVPILQEWKGFDTPIDLPAVQLLRKSYRDALDSDAVLSGFRAVCDATYLHNRGIPCVVLGPGGLSNSAHGDNEYISLDEVTKAAKIYASFIIDWCK